MIKMNNTHKVIFNDRTEYHKINTTQCHREDGPAIEFNNGDRHWYSHGKLHREDGPAIERINGTKMWYKNGLLHREKDPANIQRDDSGKLITEEWYIEGVLHNEHGVAKRFYHSSGAIDVEYYSNGKKCNSLEEVEKYIKQLRIKAQLDGQDGRVEKPFGTVWYKNNKIHREDGPAIEANNGNKSWLQNGILHNLNGPSMIQSDGTTKYHIWGLEYKREDWEKEVLVIEMAGINE